MTDYQSVREAIQKKSKDTEKALLGLISDKARLVIIKAPPGSGKTHLLLTAVAHALKKGMRCAIACQTNTQTDDICARIAKDHPKLKAFRFASSSSDPRELGTNITWATSAGDLPSGPCIVVSTTAKWGLTTVQRPFDLLFIDEAWQLAWKDFMPMGRIAGRFVLIGDPGQIPPIVAIDARRWATAPMPPQDSTPEVISRNPDLDVAHLTLPATRRLPYDSTLLVKNFYDFPFGSYAGPGDRAVHFRPRGQAPLDGALAALTDRTAIMLTLPTPDSGPPMEQDLQLAQEAIRVVTTLLEGKAVYRAEGVEQELKPEDIGLTATHRVMNAALANYLPPRLRKVVSVDTPERWQGLERPVMLAIHPMSGVTRPSTFNLETGRMCVMASRHRGALIMLGRDHIPDTLKSHIPSASQAVGLPDVTGRGHRIHVDFWHTLRQAGTVRGL